MFSFDPTSLLFLPPGLAGISLVYLGLRFSFSFLPHSLVADGKTPAESIGHRNRASDEVLSTLSSPKQLKTFAETLQELDGASIISFRTLRLLAIVSLLVLQIFDVASENGNLTNYLQLVFLVSRPRSINLPSLTYEFGVGLRIRSFSSHHLRERFAMEGHII